MRGGVVAITVEVDRYLLERARILSDASSDNAVVELALRRLVAAKQKGVMIEGIAELPELPVGLSAPVVSPDAPHDHPFP